VKLKPGEIAVIGGIAVFLVLVQLISLILAPPLISNNLQAFGNPESVLNPIIYVGLLLVFTGVLLLIIKYKVAWLIRVIMIVAILSTLVYVFLMLILLVAPAANIYVVGAVSAILSLAVTALLIVYPEWFIIDIVGIMVASGASALFGASLAIVPTIVLLVLLAVYDFISVYKTKHMITLAEGVMDLKMPILFVMPRRRGYSFREAKGLPKGEEREAYFMGLGDAVINLPALGAILGTLVSYVVLMYIVVELKKPQAGLPFLCTGSILGFLLGCVAAGSWSWAWAPLF
jgi:presenilin-like A22 family membrane protease